MTSVPLPSHLNGTTAKRESALQKYTYSGDSCETRLPRYHAASTKMNVFQSISSFLRKNKKVPERAEPLQAKRPAERKGSSVAESDDADNSDKRVEEESYEGSELSEDNKDDIAFVRSTFRQSVKRAIGWRKSQRKAVNKRKKENIHNSKLLTGGTKDEDEFYDDTELDVVVITEADGIPDDPQIKRPPAPSSSKGSKIPKRRNSTKRPAVSLKSSGFFSQSVARPRKRPDSIPLRPDPWAHAETTFTRSRHTAKGTKTCSLSMNQNRPPPVQRNHTRHPTWDGGQTRNRSTTSRSSTRSLSAVRGRNMNLSRSSLAGSQIPRYLGSTSSVSSPGTTSPDYMFPGLNMNLTDLDFSDSETENCRVPPWRNNEILHSYSRSTAETRPSSRATSSSWSSNRTRSSSTTGSRYQSRNSSWSGRQCQNSKSTSNIRSTLTPSRTDMTGSQSRIPRYLGSTTSMSSISPMSTEYHLPGLHFNYADLDFSDSDGSEKTRCDSMSKRSEGGKTVTARTNKASELREVAIKKKLESTPAQSTTPEEPVEMVPAAPPPTARRKPRASFRTKKGISRRPVHKKDIKPAENKASQLRAKKNKEELEDEQKPRSESISKQAESREPDARRSDRFSSVAIKTPAPGTENKDPLTYTQNYRNESISRVRTNSESNRLRTSTSDTPTTNLPGRAIKSSPQKPIRSKIPSTSSTSSNIPTPSPRHLPTPPTLPLSKSSEDFQTRKYSGRSEKTSSSIPKPKLSSPHDPTKELVFIPLDSVSLPLPANNKIDDMKRKRKIQRPSGVSNIFNGGAGDLPSSNIRRQFSNDDTETTFTVHVNKTPTKSVPTTPKKTYVSKTPTSSSVPNSSSIPSHLSSRLNSSGCIKDRPAKPKQVQNLSTFTRKNSIESARRSKKGIPAISRLSESNSFHSESSDLDISTSYDSCRSADDDDYIISLPGSPQLCESPRLPVHRTHAPITPVLISTDDLEIQKQKLRTPTKRSGSISVKQVRIRKSWIRPNTDNEILDPDIEKVKVALSEEVLIIEDLISGHQDIIQKLSSRTLVLKNVTSALRRSDIERAARMTVSLCFPRTHPDEEFKSMRRACVCTSDDLALFQNCLTLLLVDREKLTLPVVAILISKVRFTFEVLGSEVLRGNIGEALKLITGTFGTKIAHRDSTPGINYRLQENAEDCHQELLLVRKHVHKLTAVDYSPELLALKKTLELFDL